jgi:outer membrane protein OmpA-like peptidoglycan-associated protein
MTDLLRLSFRTLCHVAQALLCAAVLAQTATATDPLTLKDLLSRAQTDAETKAVNDLIDKLQGNARPKPPAVGAPAAAPAASAPVASPPAAAPPPSPSPMGAAPPEPNPPAASAPGTHEPSPAPDTAIAAAESQRLPSVDLEVLFAYNSDAIDAVALPTLKTLGQALSDPRLAGDNFLIAGHTDAKGGQRFNLDLSRRRAEAVRRFLAANFPIAGDRLVAKGFGLAHLKNRRQPLAAENRRVQIVNLSREQRP